MDSDRSLSSGLSIPQWMKTKMMDNRLDLDQGAFSPPGHDESFLYIRYPRKSNADKQPPLITNLPDISKHTEPCRQFINGIAPEPQIKQLKSNGTDDGFKGKSAACGTSIVKVAQQMVSEKRQQEPRRETVEFPAGFDPSLRRGSKSLPASPATSPKMHRKLLGNTNKYFTGAFIDHDRNTNWLLSGLLGKRETLSKSVTTVSEENVSGSMADLTIADEEPVVVNKKQQVYKAKPSELREMNFWSPTSM